MKRPQHEQADYFVGHEIEHSPALGQKTLFVVGVKTPQQIQAILDDVNQHSDQPITHIYFGANHSFPNPHVNDFHGWSPWETAIEHFLSLGYWCTLDFDVSAVAALLECGLTEHHQFIPMISVKMPYVMLLGYNATVKIDDRDFAATNPGVWCHALHELMNKRNYTNWAQYSADQVVSTSTNQDAQ